jgi:hypothetical protein
MKNVEPLTVKCDDPLLVGLFPVTRQCLIIRQIAGLALRFTASHVQEGGCSQSYPQKVGIEIFHATSFSVSTGLLRFDFLELLTAGCDSGERSAERAMILNSKTLVCLTDIRTRPIVFLWEEFTPRGNMVHQGIER